jgi:negative regulator of sigma-B (phosphoserine phosphatase)
MEAVTSSVLEWGVAAMTLTGQGESGDRYVVSLLPDGVLVAVMDGLGHGDDAAAAARVAAATLEHDAEESVIALARRCHDNLRATRGVVMSLAAFNRRDETMTWMGVGNVEGTLIHADRAVKPQSEVLLLRGGVIGRQLPSLQASIVGVLPGDTLILHTDGIRAPALSDMSAGDVPQRMASRILEKYAKGTDDALVLVGRYNGKVP